MDKLVSVDFNLALAPRITHGMPIDVFSRRHDDGKKAVAETLALVDDKTLGFWNLPDDDDLASRALKLAASLRERADTMVILGIGGSSLGGRTLHRALAPDAKLVFLDNVDPDGFSRALDALDWSRTVFNVISKSGGTVETAAQFCLVRDRLRKEFGEEGYRQRMVATTDPSKGLMRALADEEKLETLNVPANVGGRFSVLSAVGILPAAFAGIDVKAMQRGAQSMRARCMCPSANENPALAYAMVHIAALAEKKPIHVMMPYSDALRPFGEWFVQLWAESLGKASNRQGKTVNVGPTPLVALGSTDQHSQVQLFIEGPYDKVVTFIEVAQSEHQLPFPAELPAPYAYLKGHTMKGLLDAESKGTALALAREGRPSVTVTVPRLNAHAMGELFFLFQAATAFGGALLDVDAFDQPGVEVGKKIAFALMGRDGFADATAGMDALRKSDGALVFGS